MLDSITGVHSLRHAYGKKNLKRGERDAAKQFIAAVIKLWDNKSHCDFVKMMMRGRTSIAPPGLGGGDDESEGTETSTSKRLTM